MRLRREVPQVRRGGDDEGRLIGLVLIAVYGSIYAMLSQMGIW